MEIVLAARNEQPLASGVLSLTGALPAKHGAWSVPRVPSHRRRHWVTLHRRWQNRTIYMTRRSIVFCRRHETLANLNDGKYAQQACEAPVRRRGAYPGQTYPRRCCMPRLKQLFNECKCDLHCQWLRSSDLARYVLRLPKEGKRRAIHHNPPHQSKSSQAVAGMAPSSPSHRKTGKLAAL